MATGLTRTRIAGCSAPLTVTSATPSTCAMRWAMIEVGDVVEVARQRVLRGQRQDQDRRRRRIDLAESRQRRQVTGQVGQRGVERGLHVTRRAVDLAVEVELNRDVGVAERRGRGDLGDAGDLAKAPLQRRGHRRRHDRRIGARPARRDADGREFDGRHAGDRQEVIGHDTGQQQSDRQQRSANGPADERVGEVHGPTPPGPARARGVPVARSRAAASAAASAAPSADRSPGWCRASASG